MSKFDRFVATLPSLYRVQVNTMIGGLLKAWGASDDEIEVQIQNTKEQLFVETAASRYLDFLGNDVGVNREPGLDIGDNDFRKLIPVLSFYPKQVRNTVISLLDVFWGATYTRPNVNSGNSEPFNFGPEPLLTGTANFEKGSDVVKGTGTLFTVELNPGDYIKPNAASGTTYQKVASITSNTELKLATPWAANYAINSTIEKGVIRTLTYIADNKAEKLIRFKPFAFANLNAVTIDELVAFINADVDSSKYITASKLVDSINGDKLNIRTNTAGLLGSLQITGGDSITLARLNFPTDKTTEIKVSVLEINPNEIVVRIPSSVPILKRTLRGSTHPKGTKTLLFSDQETFDFSGIGPTSTLTLDVESNPYTITFTNASDFVDPAKVTAAEVVAVINQQITAVLAFSGFRENYKKVGLQTSEGNTNYQITGGTANTVLNFDTALQEDPDLLIATYPSSYMFDPVNQPYTVTGTKTELTAAVGGGSVSASINVQNAASFPNQPGKFILDFGKASQEGPISYNSRPNNSTLLIDAGHVFQKEHPIGSTVNFVINSPTIPRAIGSDYGAYITGTSAARIAAQALIKKLLASGVVIRFIIDFPEYLFNCCISDCGTSIDPDYRGSLTGGSPLVFY